MLQDQQCRTHRLQLRMSLYLQRLFGELTQHSEPVLSIALVLQRRDRNEDAPKDEGSGKQTMDGHIQRMRCETLTKRAQQPGEVDTAVSRGRHSSQER